MFSSSSSERINRRGCGRSRLSSWIPSSTTEGFLVQYDGITVLPLLCTLLLYGQYSTVPRSVDIVHEGEDGSPNSLVCCYRWKAVETVSDTTVQHSTVQYRIVY